MAPLIFVKSATIRMYGTPEYDTTYIQVQGFDEIPDLTADVFPIYKQVYLYHTAVRTVSYRGPRRRFSRITYR